MSHIPIRPKVNLVRNYALLKGLKSDARLAAAMGLNRSIVSRVFNGSAAPSADFIAKLRRVFPELGFDDLFEVVDDVEEQAA